VTSATPRSRPAADPARILATLRACFAAGVGLEPGVGPGTVQLTGSARPTVVSEVEALGPSLRQLVDAEARLAARCEGLTRLPHPRAAIPGPSWQGYLDVLESGVATTEPPSWAAGVGAYVAEVTAGLDAVERAVRGAVR